MVGGLLPAHAADEGGAFGIGPACQFGEFVVVDEELGGATGADDCLLAISSRFTPLQNVAERVAIPFAQMLNDRADTRAERLFRIHPGSVSSTAHPQGGWRSDARRKPALTNRLFP